MVTIILAVGAAIFVALIVQTVKKPKRLSMNLDAAAAKAVKVADKIKPRADDGASS